MEIDRTLLDRRAFSRKPAGQLEIAHGDDDAASLRLVDISLGGFSVTATRRFAPGSIRTFEFTSGGVFTLTLRAMAIHSKKHDADNAYTCGFAFLAPTDELRDTIAIVVNGLADGLLAEWPSVTFHEDRL